MEDIKIFCDGGSRGNPGHAASAFVVKDNSGDVFFESGFYLGTSTNNMAEYTAVLMAVEWLSREGLEKGIKKVGFILDSELVVKQLKGEYKIKNKDLADKAIKIKNILKDLKINVTFTHVKRSENTLADILVNKILDTI